MPDAIALITTWKPLYCDLAAVGGPAVGAVYDAAFQEIDVRTGLVRYEWDSIDHVPLSDTYMPVAGVEPGVALRLVPPQLDRARARRHAADLGAQHLGRLRPRPADRHDQLGARRAPAELHDGPGHGDRLAARRAAARLRHGHAVRQRRAAVATCATRAAWSCGSTPRADAASLVATVSDPDADLRARPRATSSGCRTATGGSAGATSTSPPRSARPARCSSRRTRRPGRRATARSASPGAGSR